MEEGEVASATVEVIFPPFMRTSTRFVILPLINWSGRGGFQQSYGPPASVLGHCLVISVTHMYACLYNAEMGSFVHACEGEMVCESVNPKIPYFNAPIYLENKVGGSSIASSPATCCLIIL